MTPVAPEDFHDYFVAAAGVAGALIGLLFVAISVAQERFAGSGDATLHLVRASAALTAFSNALVVSLFALIPADSLGPAAIAVGAVGITFVTGAVLALLRVRRVRWSDTVDLSFLVGLVIVFVVQIVYGSRLSGGADVRADTEGLAVLVVVCFVIGVARAWELVGGPSIGLRHELARRVREEVRRERSTRQH